MSFVTAIIVIDNSMSVLPRLLSSLHAQSKRPAILIIDNASTDGAEQFIRATYPYVMLLRQTNNLSVARARNIALSYIATHTVPGQEHYVVCVDTHVVFTTTYLEQLVTILDARSDIGSAAGRMIQMQTSVDGDFVDHVYTDVIDADGIVLSRFGDFIFHHRGLANATTSLSTEEKVICVSTHTPLYRLRAILDCALGQEYFDEDIGDNQGTNIDMGWRLHAMGWHALVVRDAIAYLSLDVRSFTGVSPRTHALLLWKNLRLSYWLRWLPYLWYGAVRRHLISWFRGTPRVSGARVPAWRLFCKMIKKRTLIRRRARVKTVNIGEK